MTRLAVSGFASLDYPLSLDGFAKADTTTLIARRSPAAWPRLGGCPAFVATAAARAGAHASPVTWVGADADGERYRQQLEVAGVDVSAVATVAAERSPVAVLAYQKDGSCICLYDPAFPGRERLTEQQRAVLCEADHLCITVGPPHLTEEILSARRADARLYWGVKNDPASFPLALRRRLSKEADVIFCNRAERALLTEDLPAETVVVETRGAAEVVVEASGKRSSLAVTPLGVNDTTGAGDTFAGGYIAAVMAGEDDPVMAAKAGIASVRELLSARRPLACEDA